ncbi:MAG: radical SAM protein, partial [Gammaproteobacteria bacterium]
GEYRTQLTDLCRSLGEFGVWVRLHYVYPYPHVREVIPLMAAGKLLPYLDIPLQHANARILKAMRRPAASEKALQRIREWREICPDLTVRSTFIVGFPGETERDFEELLTFIRQAELDRVGCFSYSPVDGAEANALPDWVPAEVAEERRRVFMQTQAEISAQRLLRFLGRELQVLVDGVGDGTAVARSFADAPEIDGVVRITGAAGLKPGQFARVRVTGSDHYDLAAVPVF